MLRPGPPATLGPSGRSCSLGEAGALDGSGGNSSSLSLSPSSKALARAAPPQVVQGGGGRGSEGRQAGALTIAETAETAWLLGCRKGHLDTAAPASLSRPGRGGRGCPQGSRRDPGLQVLSPPPVSVGVRVQSHLSGCRQSAAFATENPSKACGLS